ncbi:hypothetical protein [Robbsia sp. KACC 23696]|uniref:hypothetical protein n=1 Tax=Robbsia sp. KACC 23696 TaxID=3149231 RepID=UPI00325AEA7C
MAGCNGGTFDELQKAPVSFQLNTLRTRDQVARCVSDALSRFGSDVGNFPEIEPGVTRLTLGGYDGYGYRNYYLIDIADQERGTRVSVRHSKPKDDKLSSDAFNDIVSRCAP